MVHLPGGQLEVVDAQFPGFGEDRVVDVGDVADHAHLVAQVLESADDEVKGEIGEGVAEVSGVVRRDTAYVHAHCRPRFERYDFAPGRVVQVHGHGERR